MVSRSYLTIPVYFFDALGAIIATPGYSDPVIFGSGGNPYGTSVTVAEWVIKGSE